MSDLRLRGLSLRRRRATALGAALIGLLLILGGGTFLGEEGTASQGSRVPLIGRTTTVCTSGESAGKTEVSAVSIREAPERRGLLTASTLKSKPLELKLTTPGKGARLPGVTSTVMISADGAMASAGNSVIVGDVMEGPEAGLSAAPCLAPATSHWFAGLSASDADRTDLILTNPDDAQAQVDLRFYGRNGRVVVPGSPGLVIPAHDSRPVSLSSLVNEEGALGVAVQVSEGRVTAVAKRTQSAPLKRPFDWQIPSASPNTVVVIPGIPADQGGRQLVVTNPTQTRASVAVQVLGSQGPYEPTGAEALEVPPEGTATVSLEKGLAGQASSVKLTSNVPVTGSVISNSRRGGAGTDLAFQSAAVPLIGTGVSALATSNSADTDSVLIVSNGGDGDVQLSFEVLSYDGVRLRTADIVLGPNSTAWRRLNSPAPSYVVVKVPPGSSVVGGVVLTQSSRDVAGLATIPLGSPDLASRAPATRPDYSAGR